MKSMFNALIAPFKVIRNKIFFLIFLNGFLLALLAYFITEDNYENQIFKALATQVKQSTKSSHTDSILYQSLQLTYGLEKFRLTVFGDKKIQSFKSDLIRPVTFDLMTGDGACGSYSYVLSRMLNEMDIETRFAQMKVNGKFGGHIVVEAKSGNRWVALDASYSLIFTKPEGGFASFQDVKNNWNYYKSQVPANYDMSYSYDDVQYTNWSKIPILMPMLKSTLSFTMGEKAANEFSIRNVFLRKFDFLFKITLFFYIIATIVFIRLYLKQSEEIENFRISLLFPKKSIVAVSSTHVAA